jgi:putative peptidoglycan lipid II flippase
MTRTAVDILRAIMVLGASSVTVSAIGLFKNVLAAYFFGTSFVMDAYLVALVLPDIAMHFAGTGAFHFIPLFVSEREHSEDSAWRAAGKMLTYWLLLLLVVIAAALIFASPLLAIIAPGFTGSQKESTLVITRLLFFMAAFVGIARILAMVLFAQKRFLAGATSEAVFQLTATIYLIVFHSWGIWALVWGQLIGGAAQLLIVAVALLDRRKQIRAGLDLRSAPVIKMIRLSLPVYLGNVGGKLNIVVTRAFASLLSAGAVSSLQYASLVIETPVRIAAGSLTRAIFPYLSQQFAREDTEAVRASVSRSVTGTAVFFMPFAAAIYVLAEPLVRILFERGSFDALSTALTASALKLFAPAVVALGLNDLLGFVFHSRQEPTIPMTAGLVRVALNVVLCALLVPVWGHRGIALAFTISAFLKLVILMFFLRRVLIFAQLVTILRGLTRSAVAASVMVAATYFAIRIPALQIATMNDVSQLVVGVVAGASSYLVTLRLLNREEFELYRGLLRRVFTRDREMERFDTSRYAEAETYTAREKIG